ncbi:mercuric reductase [Mucilaginibacter paludis]|uniref:FAD-dependent pyridine nucleotide-disulfide oxidoreductase n=1 Tax=Mucilaginibacter paludis DSM 18603 TaxID=714943 RepID=H1Y253_9SPHI|nr:mercuric reductase [Mucilaginibacter paludis]EHQ26710.1 FAD-dependent pyridine nucleotide-disulfide oxidoreductase [Mucilaginibacter paludis DSM 18603]
MKIYDAIVIGSGQAGTPLAKKLAMAGKKTAIIEKRMVGGTCINDGCTPTKAMVASAKMAYLAGHSDNLGVHIKNFTVDLPQILKRKNEIVKSFQGGAQKGLEGTAGLDLIFGEAVFTGPQAIMVKLKDGGTEEMQADLIFINTGAKTAIPDVPGLSDIDYLTSTSILELETVPQHLLIIGASYIGMEFGQMFRRFGSKITMLETSPRALPKEDEDIAEEIVKILEAEEITFHADAKVTKVSKKPNGDLEAEITVVGETRLISCSHILVAAGRKPQTEALGLQKAGVETDDRGYVKVNDRLETNIPGVYALGDVKPGPAFTHIAYNDYTIVYRNLIEKANLSIKNRLVPYCMFTDPPLGRVGITEAEAKKQGLNYKVAKLPMQYVARAIEVGDTRGFMKAIVDADTKKILGVAILGEEGGEIVSVMQMAMVGGITYPEIRYMVFAHPTYSESLNNLFMKLDSLTQPSPKERAF